jgi:hypothetical protein
MMNLEALLKNNVSQSYGEFPRNIDQYHVYLWLFEQCMHVL